MFIGTHVMLNGNPSETGWIHASKQYHSADMANKTQNASSQMWGYFEFKILLKRLANQTILFDLIMMIRRYVGCVLRSGIAKFC